MNRKTLARIALLVGLAAAFAASAHPLIGAEMMRAYAPSQQAPASDSGLVVIPANTLTGRGAIATRDGVAHF